LEGSRLYQMLRRKSCGVSHSHCWYFRWCWVVRSLHRSLSVSSSGSPMWVSSMNDIYCCYKHHVGDKHHVGVTNVFEPESLLSNGRLLSCDWPAPEMWAVPTDVKFNFTNLVSNRRNRCSVHLNIYDYKQVTRKQIILNRSIPEFNLVFAAGVYRIMCFNLFPLRLALSKGPKGLDVSLSLTWGRKHIHYPKPCVF
jgi:hypothetical protein